MKFSIFASEKNLYIAWASFRYDYSLEISLYPPLEATETDK